MQHAQHASGSGRQHTTLLLNKKEFQDINQISISQIRKEKKIIGGFTRPAPLLLYPNKKYGFEVPTGEVNIPSGPTHLPRTHIKRVQLATTTSRSIMCTRPINGISCPRPSRTPSPIHAVIPSLLSHYKNVTD
ncbi:uncharacterized protein J3R85_012773 [Psidium guajava]|nr:uncharacterized protein J3R85_012773 [Psidium guajava]